MERILCVWSSLVWFKSHIPRQSFITWLSLHERLKTRAKIVKWGIMQVATCVLCDDKDCVEDGNHIFHSCDFVSTIWIGLLLKMVTLGILIVVGRMKLTGVLLLLRVRVWWLGLRNLS